MHFAEQRLHIRSSAPQTEESQRSPGKRSLCANEAVQPVPINREQVPEQVHGALSVGAADIDQASAWGQRGIELLVQPDANHGMAGGPEHRLG